MAVIIADDFRARFGDTTIPSTGTLKGDIAFLADQLAAAVMELEEQKQLHTLGDDPLEALKQAAKMLEVIYADLRAAGYLPPSTDWYNDPIGFMRDNALFLNTVRYIVSDTGETIH